MTSSVNQQYFRCLSVRPKSVRGILRYLGISTKRVYIMHELKAGLNADKFATFERFPKRFYHSFVLQMTLVYTFYNRLNASRLRRFWKKHENMWISKTQCWALFRFSKGTFTKTAIKPKFVDRFSLKNWSVYYKIPRITCPLNEFWFNRCFRESSLRKHNKSWGLRFTDSHVNIIIKFSLCVIHML